MITNLKLNNFRSTVSTEMSWGNNYALYDDALLQPFILHMAIDK